MGRLTPPLPHLPAPRGLVRRLREGPNVGKHLLRDLDEVIILSVHKHWASLWLAALESLLVLVLLLPLFFWPLDAATVPLVLAIGVAGHVLWQVLEHQQDRFVLTNMRVMRFHGVLGTKRASVRLSRILDTTVDKPLHGRLFGFGHLTFESAAQKQGLRRVSYVGHADECEFTVSHAVQESSNGKQTERAVAQER